MSQLEDSARERILYAFADLGKVRERGVKVIVRGEDCYVWDSEGKKYIDGLAGLQVTNIGHGRREVIEAAMRQMGEIEYWHTFGFANKPVVELAERLSQITPGNMYAFHFVNSGSEANDTAFKIARQYHKKRGHEGKYKIIYRDKAYHGMTMGATSACGAAAYRELNEPLVPGFVRIPNNHCYRCPFEKSRSSCNLDCALALERAILGEGPDTVAAFIADPVQGSLGGYIAPPPGYLKAVREICTKYDVLFIDDEVITGFGRTGKMFGIQRWDVEPDIIVMAKGLSSGYLPIGAVGVSDRVASVLSKGPFFHGITYGGHPTCAAAALANLDILEREDLPGKAREMEPYALARLQRFLEHPVVGEVRATGMMYAVEFVRDKETREPFPPSMPLAAKVVELAMDKGLIVRVGALGACVLICPPLTMTKELTCRMFDILEEALVEAVKEVSTGKLGR